MVLGDRFPEPKKLDWIRQHLNPWSVVYLTCHFSNQPPKDKFLVVARVQTETLAFVINSKPASFIQDRPSLLACQVPISCTSHTFLSYDSYIDCTEPIGLRTHEIEEQILMDMSRLKDAIAQDVRQQVIEAVKKSPTMARNLKEELLQVLSQ